MNFSDAVYLLSERGKAMQKSVPVGEGKMIAILGFDNLWLFASLMPVIDPKIPISVQVILLDFV